MSLIKRPLIQNEETSEKIPLFQNGAATKKMSLIKNKKTSEKRPLIQNEETSEKRPLIQNEETSEKRPLIQNEETSEKRPLIQNEETSEKMPLIQNEETSEKMPLMQNEEATEKVPFIKNEKMSVKMSLIQNKETYSKKQSLFQNEETFRYSDKQPLIKIEETPSLLNDSQTRKASSNISRGRRTIVLMACLYMNFSSLGMFAILGVIYVELISDLKSKRSDAALVQCLYLGLSYGSGVLVTRLVTKYHAGLYIVTFSAITGAAIACGSLAQDIGTVIALVGVVAGITTSVNLISAPVVISWTFATNRKFALSALSLGSALAQTVFPFITGALVDCYSWRGALLILSALTFLNCIPCGLMIHYSKAFFQIGENNASNTKRIDFLKSVSTDFAFILFLTTVFLYALLGSVESYFIVDVADLKGLGVQAGRTLLSMNGMFGFFGRLLITTVLKFFPNTRPEVQLSYGYLTFAVSHVCVILSSVYWLMLIGVIIRGLSVAIIIAFMPILQLELRGTDSFTYTVAITNMLMGIGDIIGGYIGGFTVDVTGSYNLIFYIAAAGALYGVLSNILIYLMFNRRKRQYGHYQILH